MKAEPDGCKPLMRDQSTLLLSGPPFWTGDGRARAAEYFL